MEEQLIEQLEEVTITPPTKRTRKSKEEIYRNAVIKRFEGAPWVGKRTVTIGGAGGIGSNVIYILAKWGYDMVLFEDDVVEFSNIGGQMYFLSDVGKTKASSILRRVGDINKRSSIRLMGRLEETSSDVYIYEVTFSCFDSIGARKILFEKWYNIHKNNPKAIFIDGRMYSEGLEVFAVTPDKADRYRETLFTDEVEDLPCNYKATTQTGMIIAGLMTGLLSNHITEIVEPYGIRELPFRTEFVIPLMRYEINE